MNRGERLDSLGDDVIRTLLAQLGHAVTVFDEHEHLGGMMRYGIPGFRTPREVLRFLYLHEWMHWYLKEELGKKSAAETTCDRFALRNYRRRVVTLEDARAALRRTP